MIDSERLRKIAQESLEKAQERQAEARFKKILQDNLYIDPQELKDRFERASDNMRKSTFGTAKSTKGRFTSQYTEEAKKSAQEFMEFEKEKNNTDSIDFMGKTYTFKPQYFTHNDYIFDPEHIPFIKYALKMIENGNSLNVLAIGEAGSGKTAFVKAFSDMFGLGFYNLNCATMKNPTEWFGERGIINGETAFVESPFSLAVQHGNTCILLDELNRTKENNRGPILSLLDDTRRVSIQSVDINVGQGTMFYATANLGDDYTGTYSFDKAEFDRFPVLKFKQMSFEREVSVLQSFGLSESDSSLIVRKMQRIRENLNTDDNEIPFSLNVRKSIQIGQMMFCGMSFEDAVVMCISNGLEGYLATNIDTVVKGNY